MKGIASVRSSILALPAKSMYGTMSWLLVDSFCWAANLRRSTILLALGDGTAVGLRDCLMVPATNCCNASGSARPVSTWIPYCASFLRSSSVSVLRLGDGVRMATREPASAFCRSSRFVVVRGAGGACESLSDNRCWQQPSDAARLRFGMGWRCAAWIDARPSCCVGVRCCFG
jgi:hypothetical protein